MPTVTALTLYYAVKLNPRAWSYIALLAGLSALPAGKVCLRLLQLAKEEHTCAAHCEACAAVASVQVSLGVDHLAQVCADCLVPLPLCPAKCS